MKNINTKDFVIHSRPHFSLDVRTRAAEGLLLFASTRGGRTHFALYMSKGRIRLSVGEQREIFNREKYNDGKWHTVSVITALHQCNSSVLKALKCCRSLSCLAVVLLVGPFQFGEEKISVGSGRHKSTGWSADKC